MLHAELVRDLACQDVRGLVTAHSQYGVCVFRPGLLHGPDAGTAARDGHGVELIGNPGEFVRVAVHDHDVVVLLAERGRQKTSQFARSDHDDVHKCSPPAPASPACSKKRE